jgi:hypothetical protein
MRVKHAQTREYMEVNALRGIVKDGAGTTLYNYFTEFSLVQQSVDFVLGTATTNVQAKVRDVLRKIETELKGETMNGARTVPTVSMRCAVTGFAPCLRSACASRTIRQPPETLSCHDQCGRRVRPALTRAEDAGGSEQDGNIADGVVARADPDGTHVRVSTTQPIKHQCHSAVGKQGDHRYDGHDFGNRQRACPGMRGRAGKNPEPEQPEARALEERRARPPGERQAGNAKADGVVGRIAKKVERVGLQRG